MTSNPEDEVRKAAQKQLMSAYNSFAVQCYGKEMFDEGITLLTRAIHMEKNEMGFYVNRGELDVANLYMYAALP